MNLAGKVAIVTGASSGIGAAMRIPIRFRKLPLALDIEQGFPSLQHFHQRGK